MWALYLGISSSIPELQANSESFEDFSYTRADISSTLYNNIISSNFFGTLVQARRDRCAVFCRLAFSLTAIPDIHVYAHVQVAWKAAYMFGRCVQGNVAFDENGDRIIDMDVVQIINGSYHVIGLYTHENDSLTFYNTTEEIFPGKRDMKPVCN